MRKVIQGHLCSTDTARKIAEISGIEIYRNKAGFYFAYSLAQKDIVLMTNEQVSALLSGSTMQIFSTAEPRGIKELREAAGLTQQQLAEAAGIDMRRLQRYESGETAVENMALGVALRLAEALNVDAAPELAEALNVDV